MLTKGEFVRLGLRQKDWKEDKILKFIAGQEKDYQQKRRKRYNLQYHVRRFLIYAFGCN